jgi:hypothetical protein
MKTTGKILLGGLIAVVLIAGILLFIIKGKVSDVVEIRSIPQEERVQTEQTYAITGFTGISASGAWDVNIEQGTDYDITLTIPRYLEDSVEVEKQGNTLTLSLKSGSRINIGSTTLEASITLPEIQEFSSRGGSQVVIRGFSLPSLTLSSEGASSIEGMDMSIEELSVAMKGASNLDFKDAEVTNADIHMDGAGSVKITMAGGTLSGNVTGASSVIYYGEVSENTLSTQGVGSIEHK